MCQRARELLAGQRTALINVWIGVGSECRSARYRINMICYGV